MQTRKFKLLTEDGSSLTCGYARIQYPLPADGSPGAWIDVPGNGASVASSIGGLLRAGYGPLLTEIETDAKPMTDDGEVSTYRRVRVLRTAIVDVWVFVRVAIRTAADAVVLLPEPSLVIALEAVRKCERERTPAAADAAFQAAARALATGSAEATMVAWAAEAAVAAVAAVATVAGAAGAAAAGAAAPAKILGYLLEEAGL